jgi:hypothetical protein
MNYDVNNCFGRSVVCADANCPGTATFDLTAIDGGVYVQLVQQNGSLYSTDAIGWRDERYLRDLNVDLYSRMVFDDIVERLDPEEDVQDDFFVMMSMPGVNYDEGMWLFVTKESYT